MSEESVRIATKAASEAGVIEAEDEMRLQEIGDKTVELLTNVIRYLV